MARCGNAPTPGGPARSLQARPLVAKESLMGLGMILLIVLVLLTLGAVPAWPHSRGWGYGPSGGLGLILVIVLVMVLLGRL
jgi:Protein of unknown function (DUF3309)